MRRGLTTIYWGLLKQPDKQKLATPWILSLEPERLKKPTALKDPHPTSDFQVIDIRERIGPEKSPCRTLACKTVGHSPRG